jgi:hypothetical protein
MPFFFAALGLLGALRGSARDGSRTFDDEAAHHAIPSGYARSTQ